MTRIAILGATGYTALELVKILLRHPDAEIVAVTSRQEGQPHIAMIHPALTGRLDLQLEDLSPAEVSARAECVFSCLPHGASAAVIPSLLDAGRRVVDFSADYRLNDPEVYARWYGVCACRPPTARQSGLRTARTVSQQIPSSPLVANPGCYPTSAILALAPLLKASMIDPRTIIVNSKSGVSGGGRTPKLTYHYPECNESISAYNVGRHRHTPEIDQVLSAVAGATVEVVFSPHLVPMDRGILTTTYSQPTGEVNEEKVLQTIRDFYADEPFVRVVDHLPGTKDSMGTNFCDVTARVVRGRVLTFSCLDNLIKGASGAAVQNFNLMYGYPETTAL